LSALPRGWARATLPELIGVDGIFSDGDWVETKDQDPAGDVRLTQLADIGEGIWRNRSERFMTSQAAERLGCMYLKSGDVLIARMPDPLGRACLFPGDPKPCVTAVDVCVVRPGTSSVDPRWLMWWLNAPQMRREVLSRQAGTTRKRISRRNLAAIAMPVPPFAEQRRVVAAIEEHLSRLDAADANIRSARDRVKGLLRAVQSRALSKEWPRRPLAEMLREPLRNGLSAKASANGTTRIITLTAVTRASFGDEHTKLADVDKTRASDLWLEPGDVLIERSNTPELVGTTALFDGQREWAIFPDLLIRVRTNPQLTPEFLTLVLQSPHSRQYFQQAAQGIAGSMPKIDQDDVRGLEVPVPPLNEQRAVVDVVARDSTLAHAVKAAAAEALQRSRSLRRSVLAHAYRGELIPQDPDDEPASVLVEQIAVERASAPKPPRRRRGKTPA
jgi:type I restriction enzyme, S subunit